MWRIRIWLCTPKDKRWRDQIFCERDQHVAQGLNLLKHQGFTVDRFICFIVINTTIQEGLSQKVMHYNLKKLEYNCSSLDDDTNTDHMKSVELRTKLENQDEGDNTDTTKSRFSPQEQHQIPASRNRGPKTIRMLLRPGLSTKGP